MTTTVGIDDHFECLLLGQRPYGYDEEIKETLFLKIDKERATTKGGAMITRSLCMRGHPIKAVPIFLPMINNRHIEPGFLKWLKHKCGFKGNLYAYQVERGGRFEKEIQELIREVARSREKDVP